MLFARNALNLVKNKNLTLVSTRGLHRTLNEFTAPRVAVSTAEIWAVGVVLCVGVFGPAFVYTANFQKYNGRQKKD